MRAVGLSRRTLQVIARARHAARRLRAGAAVADVVCEAGYYDQPHLTRSLRRLIGHTPVDVARGGMFLDLWPAVRYKTRSDRGRYVPRS